MNNRRTKIFLGILLSIALITSLFVGCAKDDGGGEVTDGAGNEQEDKDKDQDSKDQDEKDQGEPVSISYWAATSPEGADVDPKNLEVFKIVEEKTNVDIEWIHIPQGTESEQFQLMILSDKLPDVIFSKWQGEFVPDKAIEDEIIIPLNDIIEEYAPNLNKLAKDNPDLDKLLKTDDGEYYCFPRIRGLDMEDRVINGLQMRKDWLEDLNLEVPETIDDWYNVLKAFKDQKGAQIPLAIKLDRLGFLTAAWGYDMTRFVIDGDRFVYPPVEPEFKEVLETIRKWVNEGLLVYDYEDLNKEIPAGTVGAWQDTPARHIEEGQESDPNFDVIAVPNAVLNEGDTPKIFPRLPFEGNRGAAISAHCPEEKYEAVARWLDYAYSEEGYILDQFGIEGEHYTWVDDKIMPTDIMFDPEPEGLTPHQYGMRNFRPKNAPGPYYEGGRHNYLHEDALNKDPDYKYKAQAVEAWGTGDPSGVQPPLYLTAEESRKLEDYSEMWGYVGEMINKFIAGEESLDNFDKYLEEARRLGVDEVIAIYQAALDRYNAR